MADLALNDIAFSVVIKKLLLLLGQQLWIALGATVAWTTQTNAIMLAEGSVRPSPGNLISTDDHWLVSVSASIGSCLSLQVFSFVVGIVAQPSKEGESIASD